MDNKKEEQVQGNAILMLGNEAVARGAYEAGVKVAAAYPGTPSTEINENLAKYEDIYVEWSANEKVALEVAIGASMGGARSMCCMKHVGVNVAADPLFTAAYSGVNGGLLLVVADDPGMHSSQNEQDSRFYARSAHVPMLEAADSEECLEFTKLAFEISEEYDTPVMLRMVTRVAHSRSLVKTGVKNNIALKEYVKNPKKYVMMPGFARPRHLVVEAREKRLQEEIGKWNVNKAEYLSSEIGVICSGNTYNNVKEALPDASVLKLGMVYPLDEKIIKEFAGKVKTLYIIEELEPFFEDAVKAMGIKASGKDKTGLQGELFANRIAELFAGKEAAGPMETQNIPARPPALCPGCPHRALFRVLSKNGTTVIGDIGCYTLGALPPLNAMDSEICMGASIGMAVGMEKARGREFSKNMVALLGDSTFVHSGMTGLVNAVYNKANITVIIADNSTTGMTGHQPNPTTGLNIKGEPSPQLSLENICKAAGVASVTVVDPFDMELMEKTVKEECNRDGVSVIISRRPCVLLTKNRGDAAKINEDDCVSCGICMKLGCPSIQKNEAGKIEINESLCFGCGLCKSSCPKKAIY